METETGDIHTDQGSDVPDTIRCIFDFETPGRQTSPDDSIGRIREPGTATRPLTTRLLLILLEKEIGQGFVALFSKHTTYYYSNELETCLLGIKVEFLSDCSGHFDDDNDVGVAEDKCIRNGRDQDVDITSQGGGFDRINECEGLEINTRGDQALVGASHPVRRVFGPYVKRLDGQDQIPDEEGKVHHDEYVSRIPSRHWHAGRRNP